MATLKDSEFFRELVSGVGGARQGGARIIVDAEDAATGSGKTSAAVALAEYLSAFFGWDLSPADGMLSAGEYFARWQEHPGKEQPSVLILDELSGGGAADSRRAMSNSNVQLGRAWETMRTKRIITITTLPHWSYADAKMRQLADFRLHCSRDPIGYFQPYRIGASFDDGDTRTKRLGDRIKFPDMASRGHDLYEELSARKDELLTSSTMDADDALLADGGENQPDPEDVRREEKAEAAQRAIDAGLTQQEAADIVDRSQTWVSNHTD